MAKTRRASIGITVANDPVTPSLAVTCGTTPPVQWVSDGTHSPDWSVTPLILTPALSIYDPDGVAGGTVPAFGTIKWDVFIDGVRKDDNFVAANTEIDSSTGTLRWKHNLNEGETASFRLKVTFEAGGQGYEAYAAYTARCVVTQLRVPRLFIDKPPTQKYIFCREEADVTLAASLVAPGRTYVCDGSGNDGTCQFVWFRRNAAGKWARIYPDSDSRHDVMDYDLLIVADTSSPSDNSRLTIHRDMMGEKTEIMCRAIYYENGTCYGGGITETVNYASDGTLIEGGSYGDSPVAFYTTERFLRRTAEDILRVRRTYSGDTDAIRPVAYLADQMGEVSDLEKHFRVKWKTASAWNGTPSTVVAEGVSPVIPFASVSGKALTMEIEDKGSLKAITYNGKILTYNNKILLTK